MRDRLIAFICGDLLVTVNFVQSAEVLKVALLGFIGGFVGLAGKEFYSWLKSKFK